jgi:dynein heavy chain
MEKAQKKDDDLNKDEDDPYNLKVVDYDIIKEEEENGELREYFTISKKGLCHYVNGKPIEFI